MESIFARIIRGEIPAHRVYEDDHVIGFLDIHPIQPGHTLIVTKKEVDSFTDLDKSDFRDLMDSVHTFARHIKKVLSSTRIVIRIEGFDVPHVHVHLIPCEHEHDSYREGRENEEPDHDSLRIMAQKLRLN